MPALTLDIKVPNTLEQMAKKTAKALDAVTAREAKLNALLAKGMKTGKISGEFSKKVSQQLIRQKKQILEQNAKEIAFGHKKDAEGKKALSFTDKLAKNYLMVRDAVTVAFRAAKAMTLDALEKGSELEKLTQSMKFEVDLFASGTNEGGQFAELQKFAKQTKVPIKELTDEWMKFRRASTPINVVSNKQAGDLLKVWADIRAISQSSEVASRVTDEWMSKFAEGPDVAARWLAQVKAAHKEWATIGSGDFAKNIKGPLAAEDKMDAAKNKMLSAIKPLTDLMNQLKGSFADFMSKLAGNKTFKNFIKEIADDIRWLISDKGLPAMATAIADFFTKFGQETDKFMASTESKLDKVGNFFRDAFKFFSPADLINTIQKGPPSDTPPAPRAPPPADPSKHGALSTRGDKQLAGITIQNLNVTGGSDSADQIARSVRQEMQLLLQAGALSKGYA